MELRRLAFWDAVQARQVWKTCFHDSDALIAEYFRSAAEVQKGIGFFEGEKLLSDLFTLDFCANISGAAYEAGFLSGCATLPEARNRSLMRSLVRQALLDLESRGVCVSFLHPFLHAFYRKFGYETVAYVQPYQVSANAGLVRHEVHIATRMEDVPADQLLCSYRRYAEGFDNYFVRSGARMDAWLKLLFADGGKAAYLKDGGRTAYALYYEENGTADVLELVFFDPGQLASLVNACGTACNYFLPVGCGEEFTMMRVIRPEPMLQRRRYPAGTPDFVIGVYDGFLERDYNLLVCPGETGTTVSRTDGKSDIQTEIGGLAALLAGTFDRARHPDAAKIFPQGNSCYFETY